MKTKTTEPVTHPSTVNLITRTLAQNAEAIGRITDLARGIVEALDAVDLGCARSLALELSNIELSEVVIPEELT